MKRSGDAARFLGGFALIGELVAIKGRLDYNLPPANVFDSEDAPGSALR